MTIPCIHIGYESLYEHELYLCPDRLLVCSNQLSHSCTLPRGVIQGETLEHHLIGACGGLELCRFLGMNEDLSRHAASLVHNSKSRTLFVTDITDSEPSFLRRYAGINLIHEGGYKDISFMRFYNPIFLRIPGVF